MIEREIAEFGRRMGMPAFSLSPAGRAALDVERFVRLHLELAENAGERELLVYLARAVPEYDVKAPRRVLERCHYRHADPMPLSGGVHKGNKMCIRDSGYAPSGAKGFELLEFKRHMGNDSGRRAAFQVDHFIAVMVVVRREAKMCIRDRDGATQKHPGCGPGT